MDGFRVIWRNVGHWDIWNKNGRIARIRGQHGSVYLWFEHDWKDRECKEFKTVDSCMSYLCSELMFEALKESE